MLCSTAAYGERGGRGEGDASWAVAFCFSVSPERERERKLRSRTGGNKSKAKQNRHICTAFMCDLTPHNNSITFHSEYKAGQRKTKWRMQHIAKRWTTPLRGREGRVKNAQRIPHSRQHRMSIRAISTQRYNTRAMRCTTSRFRFAPVHLCPYQLKQN